MWHSAQSAHTYEQPNCRGQPQNKESSPGPTARKHRKQSLQVSPYFALIPHTFEANVTG
jgi:hypothetical protein